MTPAVPLVTLGLPVYNGAEHVVRALRGMQAQTWPRLEILVSDNASTDDTERICRDVARTDSRIRYVRQPANVGAARNFELLAAEARGELFAWCAHDDERLPRFVEECATELERSPECVLCSSSVTYLDDAGAERRDWWSQNFATRGMPRAARAARLVDHTHWVEMYGVIRTDALRRALPFEPVWGFDVVLSMKLLTSGHFATVRPRLFRYRQRTASKPIASMMRNITGAEYRESRPFTQLATALFRAALDGVAVRGERDEIVRRMLRTMSLLGPRGPFPSWRQLLGPENGEAADAPHDAIAFPRRLAAWVSPGIGPAEEAAACERLGREVEEELRRRPLVRARRRAESHVSHVLPRVYASYRDGLSRLWPTG